MTTYDQWKCNNPDDAQLGHGHVLSHACSHFAHLLCSIKQSCKCKCHEPKPRKEEK
jgi:hypothetical protein